VRIGGQFCWSFVANLLYLCAKNYWNEIRSVELGSLSNATFSFLIMWHSSSSKSAAVYKISWKSDFSPRYGDIPIFKMAAVRHLGIVLPQYETTHEVSVAGRSCLSNFMSIWYTELRYRYLNFSHIWLEMPIQAPKLGVLAGFGPLNVISHHRYPKRHILA